MTKKEELQLKVSQRMTDHIVEAIERGEELPWNKPWQTNGTFANVQSGRAYNGWNPFWLEMYNIIFGYTQPYFITPGALFKLAKQRGEFVKLDNLERKTFVSFFSPVEKEKENENGEIEKYNVWIFKAYQVYNIQQVENWEDFFSDDLIKFETGEEQEHEEIAEASNFFKAYSDSQGIELKEGPSAFYDPNKDFLAMPPLRSFESSNAYYHILGHESVHSTGHKDRLNRFKRSGLPSYQEKGHEELVADIGASMLGQLLGTLDPTEEQRSLTYKMGWAKRLKNDPALILNAAIDANKAVKYMVDAVNDHQ